MLSQRRRVFSQSAVPRSMPTRRQLLAGAIAVAGLVSVDPAPGGAAQTEPAAPAFSYPLGIPGRPLGDGFFLRHAFTVENTWYLPDFWHAGEDWYLLDGDTASANVYAVADGDVVYTGGNYPGLVVIVRHAGQDGDLFSMYGHLDFAAAVELSDVVQREDPIGTILRRSDAIPNHLHFEIRSFLQTAVVNGDAPLYGFGCGPDCPPGPGYWPIGAPDLPADIGWRNPTHVIGGRGYPDGVPGGAEIVVASQPSRPTAPIWSAPEDEGDAERQGELSLEPGARFPLLNVSAGPEAPDGTSAEAYRLWYELALPDGGNGWVRAAVATSFETGGDGRPSTVRLDLLPDVSTPD